MKKLLMTFCAFAGLFATPCVASVPASTSSVTIAATKGQVAAGSGFIEILHRCTRLGLILSFR